MLNNVLNNAAVRILIPPLIGFLFYGSWAFWANIEHGQMAGAKAALTQGSYSFTITLVLALLIEWLFKALKHMRFHLSLVGTIACSLLYTSSWGINYLTGTPNIFLTILPGAAVSTVYTVMYIVTLSKLSQHR